MDTINFEQVPMVWEPNEFTGQETRKFWLYISEKYNVELKNYWDLYQWSLNNLEDFYAEMWQRIGIIASKPYEKVLDLSVSFSDGPEWFPGARLNFAENILKCRDDRLAIIATGEDREVKKYTYAEIYAEACRYSAALRKLGLVKNDRVVCYMSNREHAIFAMLGTIATGAIFSAALPYLGRKAVLRRFQTVSPKFLFTTDSHVRNRSVKEMLSDVKEIVDGLPSLEKVIVIPSKPESRQKDISFIKNSCFLEEFLSLSENTDDSIPELVFEQVPFSHPVFIEYTTGTTGEPKAVAHGCGGLLSVAREHKFLCSADEKNIWLSVLPAGCISWTMFSTLLITGYTMVMYEGFPFFLHPTAFWDLVDEFEITHLFLAACILDQMEKMKCYPGEKNTLASLTTVLCTGTVVYPRNYVFVYNYVKRGLTFAPIFGCTESIGALTVLERTLPVYLNEMPAPTLGMNICCYNDEGNPVWGKIGELVLVSPSPSLPLFLWGDKDRKLYKETYFGKYKDAFLLGDLIIINPVTRGIIAVGRSGTILKQGGTRFSPAQIYNVVEKMPDIMDSLCVSQKSNNDTDERTVLFVQLNHGHHFTEKLEKGLRTVIEMELTKNHVPDVIVQVEDIPKSMIGKKMEIIVKNIINKTPYNADHVINPGCLPFFERFADLQNLCSK